MFVLGGASIYMAMFPYLDRIYVTKIGATPKSDAYFPNLDSLPDWKCVEVEPLHLRRVRVQLLHLRARVD